MFEIVIFILVLLAAFIGVAWYARRSSQQRAMDLDLDHLEPEINLDNDFNDYFEHELQQQSIGDIDSEPSVSLSTAAEKIESELEPIINLEEKTAEPQVSTKKVQSTIDFVIDDDIEPIDETMASPADQQAVKSSSPRDNVERIRPTAVEAKPKSPRKDRDDLVIALTIMAPENERFSGRAVKAALESSNLHFGDLQVYHRFTAGARRQSIFSVANILDPGTLLPDKFISLTTPGLLIFARLPGPVNGLAMFDDLLETAQSLTEKLGGTLSDDTREPISESRLEAMRSRIFNLNFAIHNENHDYSN
ncbi:MAG: cell division protein ZipA [Pseudomonadota bacterium]|nr:cell division protein ZipA [Pseudomonadota bacterium]